VNRDFQPTTKGAAWPGLATQRGSLEMLQWATTGKGPRFGLIVHHTDAERESAYDRDTHFGRLDRALDAAPKNGSVVVDMKKEWKRVFPFEK
jgi:hypothetical protein